MTIFGNLLSRCRKVLGETQQQFITQIAMFDEEFNALNTVTLSRWENGTTATSLYRKRLILRYFHTKGILTQEPCRSMIQERFSALQVPLSKTFEHNYESIIHNLPKLRIPLDAYETNTLEHCDDPLQLQHLIDVEIASHAPLYYKNTPQRLLELVSHPETFSMVIKKNRQHLGHFIMYKTTPEASEKIVRYQLKEHELTLDHLVKPGSSGDYYIHAFYGVNPVIAAMLNVHTYLHLFKHIDTIKDVVIFSSRKDGVRLAKAYGIEMIESGDDLHYGITWNGMRSPVEDILFSDTVLRLVF